MDLIMTMFKPRSSQSPVKVSASPKKRAYDSSSLDEDSPSKSTSNNKRKKSNKQATKEEEPRFTFDEVKCMIEKLLTKRKSHPAASIATLKNVSFDEIAIPGHSVQVCKDLIEQLVKNTRRTRTLYEVLEDVKNNLKKRVYTEIIQRASLDGEAPRRPPSAYLLFHQERYNELKYDNPLAAEVSKQVSLDWKSLSDRQRQIYQERHEELMEQYRNDMTRLGLIDEAPPRRPRSAKSLYIQHRMKKMKINVANKQKAAEAKNKFEREYENLGENDKKIWLNQFKAEKERFEKERQEYVASHPHLNHTTIEKPRTREPKIAPPQPPQSALKYFLQKKMPEGLEGAEFDEMKKQLKEKFHSLSEKKVLRFIKKAVRDKERYEEELAVFKSEHPEVEIPKLKPSISKDQWKLYAIKVEKKPVPPAPTAYLHYCGKLLSDMYTDNSDNQAPTQRMQAASISWKNASEEERLAIELEHREAIAAYIDSMDKWLLQQTEERRQRVLTEDPKAQPEYWRKKLNRLMKVENKKCSNSKIDENYDDDDDDDDDSS